MHNVMSDFNDHQKLHLMRTYAVLDEREPKMYKNFHITCHTVDLNIKVSQNIKVYTLEKSLLFLLVWTNITLQDPETYSNNKSLLL